MNTNNIDEKYHQFMKKRGLFWPFLLILLGLGLLLENFGVLPPLSLARLWPALLLVWGLDLFWHRYNRD